MDNQNKTVFIQQGEVPQKKSSGKAPLIALLVFGAVIIAGLLYYFLVYNSDPKIKIEYAVTGSVEQKNSTTYEQLYKSSSEIQINVILDKSPRKNYEMDINGTRTSLEFTQEGGMYKASFPLKPDMIRNSYYTVKLEAGSKTLFSDNFNVVIIKPNISSKEFIENYLKTYSTAVYDKSSPGLQTASNFWKKDLSGGIFDKMRKNLPELTSVWSDNIMSTPEDDVNAKVYLTYNRNNKWTYVTAGYFYRLEVVKGQSGQPEWKILDAKETIEKRDTFNYDNMEGD